MLIINHIFQFKRRNYDGISIPFGLKTVNHCYFSCSHILCGERIIRNRPETCKNNFLGLASRQRHDSQCPVFVRRFLFENRIPNDTPALYLFITNRFMEYQRYFNSLKTFWRKLILKINLSCKNQNDGYLRVFK